jgi:peptidoglycan/LPS O-acetylase OafA/YrhL
LADRGAIGVDIFFVISGFIMVYISRDKFGSPGCARSFIANRLRRIVPLCWVYLTLTILVAVAAGETFTAGTVLRSYLLFPTFNPDGLVMPILTQAWTLEYELFFYITFAAWIMFGSWKKTPLFLALFLGSVVALAQYSHGTSALTHFASQSIMLEFAYGAAAGWLASTGRMPNRRIGMMLMGMSAFMLIRPSLFFHHGEPRMVSWGIPAFQLVLGALAADNGKTGTVLMKIGDWSYSIYLAHILVIRGLMAVIKGLVYVSVIGDMAIVCILAACIGVGYLSYRYIETPMMNWFSRPPIALQEGGSAKAPAALLSASSAAKTH